MRTGTSITDKIRAQNAQYELLKTGGKLGKWRKKEELPPAVDRAEALLQEMRKTLNLTEREDQLVSKMVSLFTTKEEVDSMIDASSGMFDTVSGPPSDTDGWAIGENDPLVPSVIPTKADAAAASATPTPKLMQGLPDRDADGAALALGSPIMVEVIDGKRRYVVVPLDELEAGDMLRWTAGTTNRWVAWQGLPNATYTFVKDVRYDIGDTKQIQKKIVTWVVDDDGVTVTDDDTWVLAEGAQAEECPAP